MVVKVLVLRRGLSGARLHAKKCRYREISRAPIQRQKEKGMPHTHPGSSAGMQLWSVCIRPRVGREKFLLLVNY